MRITREAFEIVMREYGRAYTKSSQSVDEKSLKILGSIQDYIWELINEGNISQE